MDGNLKSKPKYIWKYFSKFKKSDHVFTQLRSSENIIIQPPVFLEPLWIIFLLMLF
jgi:hypothetical protein